MGNCVDNGVLKHLFCRNYVISRSINQIVLDVVRRERRYEMDDRKYMFQTSISMNWDQQKSFKLEQNDTEKKNHDLGVQEGCLVLIMQ